ncbi:MAG: hypothetical protein JSW10_06245, partial [Pseudomonadota bacterium]
MSKWYLLWIGVFIVLIAANSSAVAGGMSQQQYADQYGLYGKGSEQWPYVKECLAAWGSRHPFRDTSQLRFRVVEGNVKVFGIGSNVTDKASTSYPQLILIKPAVNVMGKSTYNLMNPNGWYCLVSKVNVMASSTINLHCKAHIASSKGGTTVL